MENFEEFYKTICRVCLSYNKGGNMKSLIDSSSQDGLSCFGKAATTFAKISITFDLLPHNICEKCLFLLKQAIQFKKLCENSDKQLKSLAREFEDSPLILREKVSEYVLYTQNFPSKSDGDVLTTNSVQEDDKGSISCEKNIKKEILVVPELGSDLDDFYPNDYLDQSQNISNRSPEADELLETIEKVIDMPSDASNTNLKYNKPPSKTGLTMFERKRKENEAENLQNLMYCERLPNNAGVKCRLCNKILINKNSFRLHIRRHKQGQYVCEQCAKRFATHAELQYHLSASHGIGRHFLCKICGYKAPRRFELKEHERIHTGERPYECDQCGKTFRRQFIWKKHLVYHTEKTVPCPHCSRKFFRHSEMLSHANSMHERVRMYACYECDVTYAKPATVRRHLTDKHGIAREMQRKIPSIRIAKSSVLNKQ